MLEREILVIFLSFLSLQTIDRTISQPYNTIRKPNLQDGDILNPDNKIYLFENSTQCNSTRLVYAITGYDKVCKRTKLTDSFTELSDKTTHSDLVKLIREAKKKWL